MAHTHNFLTNCSRPPYHGTWSKSSIAKHVGRNPFIKEPALDYDVDSEAEWEEGDDEPGEDVDNDVGDEEEDRDEEGDTRMYNYQDGWLAQDDELGDDDELDEEAKKLLRSRKRAEGSGFVPVCIIAPANGGIPVPDVYVHSTDPALTQKVEGFSVQQAYKLAAAHEGETLVETDIYLDAFPPALLEEKDWDSTQKASNSLSAEPTKEDVKAIARFVHHSNFASKSQLVEELRNAHSSVTSSKAQAQRVLESIADKRKHPRAKNGVYWEVRPDVLEDLGLHGLKVRLSCLFKSISRFIIFYLTTGWRVEPFHKAMEPLLEEDPKEKTSTGGKKQSGKAENTKSPVVSGSEQGSAKKKKQALVSAASADLLAKFLSKK